MSAKHKLNSANFIGVLVIAGAVGLVCQSAIAFLLTLAALAVAAYHAGDIRT